MKLRRLGLPCGGQPTHVSWARLSRLFRRFLRPSLQDLMDFFFSRHSLHGQNCLLALIFNTNAWRKLAFTFFVERFRDQSPWRAVFRQVIDTHA